MKLWNIYLGLLFILLSDTACSVYTTRFYSRPEFSAANDTDSISPMYLEYRYNRFLVRHLPQVFQDSLDATVVSVRIHNEYDFSIFGPPLIPILPTRQGYGYSDKKLNQADSNKLKTVTVEIEINPGEGDSVVFDPFSFYLISRKTQVKSLPVSVNGLSGQPMLIHCRERTSLKIEFSPGMKVQDKPLIFLQSLQIGGKMYRPEGIPFRVGKKSFYAPMIMVNG